jgi:hypothetical protein
VWRQQYFFIGRKKLFVALAVGAIIKKEVAWGGERTRGLSISFMFSFFSTSPLSHSGSPVGGIIGLNTAKVLGFKETRAGICSVVERAMLVKLYL